MNPFIAHPQKQGITYTTHLFFAMGIAMRLFHSMIAFASHAIFPFMDIRRSLDLEATRAYLQERNEWIQSKKPAQKSSLEDSKQWEQIPLAE